MTLGERVAWAWATVWAVALAYAYLLSYAQPNRNRLTKVVTKWSSRKFGRWSIVGRPQMLLLGALFAVLAVVGLVFTVSGLSF